MKKIVTLVTLAFVLVGLTWCSLVKKTDTMNAIDWSPVVDVVPAQWATVSVDYVGSLEDGTVFDTSIEAEAKKAWSGVYSPNRKYAPLTFTVGWGQMIKWFDEAVIGMKKGETKTVTIPTDKAYGAPKAELTYTTGVTMFTDAGITPVIGESYNFGGAPGKVVSIQDDKITLDFNHVLAGKTLVFKITLLDVTPVAGAAPVAVGTEDATTTK
jgi:FKBP-type peptidyl-prolyl cis-trans isomerase 2